MTSALLQAALQYAEKGWPVLPLHRPMQTGSRPICSCEKCGFCKHVGKHPRFHAHHFRNGVHSATTNPASLALLWDIWPDANVGVATGSRAGIVVLDIDPRNGGDDTLGDLEADLGRLPSTVEAKSGGGGRHLVFRHPGFECVGTLGPGVDVLDDGQHFVSEPSLHPSGRQYLWELSSTPEIVELSELTEAWKKRLFLPVGAGGTGITGETGETGETGGSPPTLVIPASPASPASPAVPANPAIPVPPMEGWTEERLFSETLPRGRGQHDQCTLRFARGVRLNLGITDDAVATSIFDRWFVLARPHIANQDWDEGYQKFLRAFQQARIPLGADGFADLAYQAALTNAPPRIADRARGERARLLISMCREMNRIVGSPFKLSCHQVGRLFRVQPAKAHEWLRGLETLGVIKCENRGRPGRPGSNAASFTYLGD